MRLRDLEEKIDTIRSATKASGEIDRAKANRMVDPRGYFAATKRKPKQPKNTKNF